MTLFFELIRVAIGTQKCLSHTPSEAEWQDIYDTFVKQTMIGICVKGMQHLPESQRPPEMQYLEWIVTAAIIQQRNKLINESCAKIETKLKRKGFGSCILKGQGIGKYYGEMSEFRQSGDIDIWMWPTDEDGTLNKKLSRWERRKKILSLAHRLNPNCKPVYHNVAVEYGEDIQVEMHFTPSWLFSPFHNARLQHWVEAQATSQFKNQIELSAGKKTTVATLEFNRIHVLLHIYRHLFGEGIGLRQILDYFFVLRASADYDKEATMNTLQSFGATRFTRALMWILKTQFGLEDKYLLCDTDEREGQFLLSELMLAGNFGHYDTRIERNKHNGFIGTFWKRIRRNMTFITHYPSEVLWCPLWKVWHQLWLIRFRKTIA